MSTCISRHGEFGSHTLDDEYTCTRCAVLDEEAIVGVLKDYRARLDVVEGELDKERDSYGRLAKKLDEVSGARDLWRDKHAAVVQQVTEAEATMADYQLAARNAEVERDAAIAERNRQHRMLVEANQSLTELAPSSLAAENARLRQQLAEAQSIAEQATRLASQRVEELLRSQIQVAEVTGLWHRAQKDATAALAGAAVLRHRVRRTQDVVEAAIGWRGTYVLPIANGQRPGLGPWTRGLLAAVDAYREAYPGDTPGGMVRGEDDVTEGPTAAQEAPQSDERAELVPESPDGLEAQGEAQRAAEVIWHHTCGRTYTADGGPLDCECGTTGQWSTYFNSTQPPIVVAGSYLKVNWDEPAPVADNDHDPDEEDPVGTWEPGDACPRCNSINRNVFTVCRNCGLDFLKPDGEVPEAGRAGEAQSHVWSQDQVGRINRRAEEGAARLRPFVRDAPVAQDQDRTEGLDVAIEAARNASCEHIYELSLPRPCLECRIRAASPLIEAAALLAAAKDWEDDPFPDIADEVKWIYIEALRDRAARATRTETS